MFSLHCLDFQAEDRCPTLCDPIDSSPPGSPVPGILQARVLPWNGLNLLGDSGNGGSKLEFLSPLLWRAPPLEMRRERREFFPDHAGKGSLLSSYEAETGLLWMCGELSCFLSSGDRYVGDLLELQQRCEGPFGSSRV